MSSACAPSACNSCLIQSGFSQRLRLDVSKSDFVIALAGNPNTGKSTVFNRLTGLRQHTGNWPGKTIARAEGGFAHAGKRFKLVDLPGTYSLRSTSPDETVAREFILFGKPDVPLVEVDANCLERILNLLLQILQITDRAVLSLNFMDEGRQQGGGRCPHPFGVNSAFLWCPAPPVPARACRSFWHRFTPSPRVS